MYFLQPSDYKKKILEIQIFVDELLAFIRTIITRYKNIKCIGITMMY